ncbi:MAG: YceI family protein [Ferruginibacter sp.]
MKKTIVFALLSLALLKVTAFTVQAIINWKINNEKSSVKFTMNAHGQELIGSFTGVEGSVKFDPTDLTNSSLKCSIAVSTINTGNEKRNGHLQAAGWFDAAKFAAITFASTKLEATVSGGYTATGTLSLKGTEKEISFPFTFEENKEGGIFKGSFTILRGDYGVGKTDGDVSNEVTINLEVPVTKEVL